MVNNIVLDKPLDAHRLETSLAGANLEDLLTGYKLDEVLERDRLSGGQAQRLGFARLLYRDNPIWLLDEPVAHLDAVAADKLFDLVRRMRGKKTIIMVLHTTEHIKLVQPDQVVAIPKIGQGVASHVG